MRELIMPRNGRVNLSPRHKGVSENAKAARWSVWHQEKNQGVEPCAVKAASTVLNGGDEETCGNVTRLVPTQPGFRPRLTPGVRRYRRNRAVGSEKILEYCPYV